MVTLPHRRKAFRSSFPVGESDPYWNSVALLLHFDGSNGSTSFVDSSSIGRTVTASGNAQLTTSYSYFGSASGTFDGSGDYISTDASSDFDISQSEWTVEFFLRPTTAVNLQRILSFDISGTTWGLYNSGSALQWARFGAAGLITSSSVLVAGTWIYIALVKNGSTTTMYVNGSSVGSTSSVPSSANYTLRVGGNLGAFPTQNLNAQVDELRFSTIARTISSVPTSSFPNS